MTLAQVSVPASLESLSAIRAFIEEQAAAAGLDESTAFGLMLAMDEAAANVIEHGGATEHLEVRFVVDGGEVRATLVDRGTPFDPRDRPDVDVNAPVEERGAGGLGWYFIIESVHAVEYRTDSKQNELTLIVSK